MDSVPDGISGSSIVIVGGGVAGGNAAATLREEGFAGRVVIVSREPGVPLAGLRCPRRTCGRRRISKAGMSGRPAGVPK
jgi:glycine/D-amino acid oxidase-like deaminating enzyme